MKMTQQGFIIIGADEGTRTPTPLGTSFLDWRGYHYTTSALIYQIFRPRCRASLKHISVPAHTIFIK